MIKIQIEEVDGIFTLTTQVEDKITKHQITYPQVIALMSFIKLNLMTVKLNDSKGQTPGWN